jgi:hypothetical protein
MSTVETTLQAWRAAIAGELAAAEAQLEPAAEAVRVAKIAADTASADFQRLEIRVAGALRDSEPLANAARARLAETRQTHDAIVGRLSQARAVAANVAALAADLRQGVDQIDRALSPAPAPSIDPDAGRPLSFPRRAGPAVEVPDVIEFPRAQPAA